ncbi:hypothetical protein BD414DRAFT_87145 [Trametes punicea]|nr:hypothetical protein BD414DRAFT_87145 [Trametes punicea]
MFSRIGHPPDRTWTPSRAYPIPMALIALLSSQAVCCGSPSLAGWHGTGFVECSLLASHPHLLNDDMKSTVEIRCNECRVRFGGAKSVRKDGIETGHQWKPLLQCLNCQQTYRNRKAYKRQHSLCCPAPLQPSQAPETAASRPTSVLSQKSLGVVELFNSDTRSQSAQSLYIDDAAVADKVGCGKHDEFVCRMYAQ